MTDKFIIPDEIIFEMKKFINNSSGSYIRSSIRELTDLFSISTIGYSFYMMPSGLKVEVRRSMGFFVDKYDITIIDKTIGDIEKVLTTEEIKSLRRKFDRNLLRSFYERAKVYQASFEKACEREKRFEQRKILAKHMDIK